ncbi:hypothetical protein DsansV1_C05g0055171 [Dioscorea sansibarensis]
MVNGEVPDASGAQQTPHGIIILPSQVTKQIKMHRVMFFGR